MGTNSAWILLSYANNRIRTPVKGTAGSRDAAGIGVGTGGAAAK
jgi:hypothetical protein